MTILTFSAVALFALFAMAVLPLVSWLLSSLLQFVLRKPHFSLPNISDFFDPLDYWSIWVISLAVVLIGGMLCNQVHILHVTIPLWVFFIPCIPYALRFVCDIIRGVSWNRKSGDLDKIKNMQAEIDDLKKSIADK